MNSSEFIKYSLGKSYDLPEDAIASEFFDVFRIVSNGARKYELNGWLSPDGKRCSEKEMHDSMFHHLAESFAGVTEDR